MIKFSDKKDGVSLGKKRRIWCSQVRCVMCWTVPNSITVSCREAYFLSCSGAFTVLQLLFHLLDCYSARKHCTAKALSSSRMLGWMVTMGIRKQEWKTLMVSLANCDELLLLGTSTIKSFSGKNQEKEMRKAENEWSTIVFACFISVLYLESWHPLQPGKHQKRIYCASKMFPSFFFSPFLIENIPVASFGIEMKNKFSQFCRTKTIFYFGVVRSFSYSICFPFINLNVAWNGRANNLLYDALDP